MSTLRELEHRRAGEVFGPQVVSNASKDDAESKSSFHLCRVCPRKKSWQRRDDALVPFTQECGQNVFADSLTPQVIAAVAARVSIRVEVDPMVLGSSGDAVATVADSLTAKPDASLQTVEVDAAGGVEVDQECFGHVLLPIQAFL
jgi:hypothetical protein